MFRTVSRRLLGILALCSVVGADSRQYQKRSSDLIQRLRGAGEVGELPRDVGKLYRVSLRKGEMIHLSAREMGADVALVLVDPARNDLFKVDSLSTTEHLFFVAPTAGIYAVRIEDDSEEKKPGKYFLRVEGLQVANDRDRKNAQAETAYYVAKDLRGKGLLKEAESSFRYAIQSWQDLGNRARQADGFCQLGQVQNAAHNFDGALASFQRSADLRATLREFQAQADALQKLANVYEAQGNLRQAERILEQVLQILRQSGDEAREIKATFDLARVEQARGGFESAIDHFNQIIKISERQKLRSFESQALNGRGVVYYKVGMMDQALDDAERALRLVDPSDLLNQAVILSRKVWVYGEQGKLAEALALTNQALALRRRARDARGEGVTLSALGFIYFRLNRVKDALNAFQRSVQIFRDGGFRKEAIDSMVNLGWVHATQGRAERALKIFNEGLPLAREEGNRPTEAKLLYAIAYVERQRGNPIAAIGRIDEAIAVTESLRSAADRRDVRQYFLADHADLYGLKIELLMEQNSIRPGAGYDRKAFQTSEWARARGLFDALAEEGQRGSPQPDLIEEHQRLQDTIDELYQQLQRPEITRAEKGKISSRLRSLIGQDEDLEARMRGASSWPEGFDVPSLWEIQNRILDKDTVLLEYYLSGGRGFGWAVTPRSFQSFEIKCSGIRDLARKVYRRMADGSLDDREPEAAEDLQRLSNCVLEGAGNVLAGKRALVVSHDELQKIPFAALLEPGAKAPVLHGARISPYLALRHEVVNIPSVSVLSMLRKQRRPRPSWKRFLSLVGDAVYNTFDDRLSREAAAAARHDLAGWPEPYSFSRLPGSRDEAGKILSMMRSRALGVNTALGFQATRTWVEQGNLSHAQVVHFTTHAVLNNSYPQMSGLVLSLLDRQGRRQDGLLRAHDIESLRLDADLVVLSACQTALGKNVRGEGLVGLTQAFFIGGASSVLVSLWKIDDRASAEMMSQFYKHLLENRPPATALRLAQESMIAGERWRSPYYWAGFILQGEWKQGGVSRQVLRK